MIKASLEFKNNQSTLTEIADINAVLQTVGIYLESFALPANVRDTLVASKTRKMNAEEYQMILDTFTFDRADLMAQIQKAKREPAVAGGGSLITRSGGNPPYPKVYDLLAMDAATLAMVHEKFGKMHVNCTDEKIGVDEFMTVLSGDPWIWFFRLKDDTVAKLTLVLSEEHKQGWRLTYPGLTQHGAHVGNYGLCLAQVIGPDEFDIRYQGTNPWLNFTN